ncbi:54S ribosomal protein L3 mitochondrial [Savitreella phatthalungensis]
MSIAALHRRLLLHKNLNAETLRICLTDASNRQHTTNTAFARLGQNFLEHHVSRSIAARWPRLPLAAHNNVVENYAGTNALSGVGRSWGIETSSSLADLDNGKLVHMRVPSRYRMVSGDKSAQYQSSALGDFVRAIIGASYMTADAEEAARMIDTNIMSRALDHMTTFKLSSPQRQLSHLLSREGLDGPITRLLAANGQFSNQASYTAGVFTGLHRLSEATGSSLREAEYKAQSNALKAWYLLQAPGLKNPDGSAIIDAGQIVV